MLDTAKRFARRDELHASWPAWVPGEHPIPAFEDAYWETRGGWPENEWPEEMRDRTRPNKSCGDVRCRLCTALTG